MRTTLALVLAFVFALAAPVASATSADEEILSLARGDASDPIAVLEAQLRYGLEPPTPPALVYRDVRSACDLDGDSVADVIVNNLTLRSPPSQTGARSEIEALSGVTGERIWKVDNLAYARMRAPSSVPYTARGQAAPDVANTAEARFDVDGDGSCDVIAYGFDQGTGYAAPFVGEPSVSTMPFVLRALSGRTGEPLWTIDLAATTTTASDPLFGTATNVVTSGFPTGVLPFETSKGPRIALKLTDLRYHMADTPIDVALVPTLEGQKGFLKGPLHAEDVRITEHIQILDAASGERIWQRSLGTQSASAETDASYTNLTWLSGLAELNGDDTPDLVLDQMVINTPRTTEANHPVTGDTMFRYGRGARVTALDGADGTTLWVGNLIEPLAAQANVQGEENFETLAWMRSEVAPDIDGDGVDEVLATYTAKEESLATTIAGAYRTHFMPLSGANGTALWDVRQQGWGVARSIGGGLLALGMLDVPAAPPEGAAFPPRFVRALALDAATGQTVWSYERSFAQSSLLSYNLALSQFNEALAPFDWNGDGIRDVVTPAQETPRTGRDQVLLATSSHTYSVLSGASGDVIGDARAWGPDGRVLACAGSPGELTVVSGHGRRLELARFDPLTSERSWRHVIHNDPAPRAATSAIDITGLAASCLDRPDGGALFGVDLQAYSFDRLHEVIPVLGVVDGAGELDWQVPALRGSPPSDALFQASIDDANPSAGAIWSTVGFAVVFGLAAALGTIAILARAGSKLLVVGLMLLVLAPGAISIGLPPVAPSALAPRAEATPSSPIVTASASPPDPRTGDADDPAAAELGRMMVSTARELALGAKASNESLSRFGAQGTVSFTYAVGDVDGDGFDDIALDQYCMDDDACSFGVRLPEDAATYATSWVCGYYHDLVVVSGANGTPLWTRDLTLRGAPNMCGDHFVHGTLRVGEEEALLVQRYQTVWYSFFRPLEGVVTNDLMAISARTGEPLWTYSLVGTYNTDFTTTLVAKDVFLMPILASSSSGETSLFVQGIGWTSSVASTLFNILPGYPITDDPLILWDVHEPTEWAARLDLKTGTELWKRDTFQPVAGFNTLPRAQTFQYADTDIYFSDSADLYWDHRACCGDMTGDGTPDLAFTLFEWAQTPAAKVAAPLGLDVRFVVYDGASGDVHLDRSDGESLPGGRDTSWDERYAGLMGLFLGRFITQVQHEAVGDVDGDGADDVLMKIAVRDPEYRQDLTMVSGRTGEALWTMTTAKDLRALVLGDADEDGGADFLLLDWYGHEGTGAETFDDLVTPQAVPLELVSGRTGERIWMRNSYAAPADILESYKASYRNGVVDVDGDGVADFFTDDPLYLDDQTVVHQTSVISGRDGATMSSARTVGAFAIPMGAGDLDRDGRAEFAILSGDVNDLWLTVYAGATGDAAWSRRIVAMPASGYASALPSIRLDTLGTPTGEALAVTFHLETLRSYTYFGGCIGMGCDDQSFGSERIGTTWSLMPQILRVRAQTGALDWALPALNAIDGEARALGATPGAAAFDEIAARAGAVGLLASAGREARPFAFPALGGFAIAYAIGLGGGIAVVRFRSRFEGVPELE